MKQHPQAFTPETIRDDLPETDEDREQLRILREGCTFRVRRAAKAAHPTQATLPDAFEALLVDATVAYGTVAVRAMLDRAETEARGLTDFPL